MTHGIEIGEQVIDTTIALNHFGNIPGYGILESSAQGSRRNSYTNNKFANIGLAAAYLQQRSSSFSGNTIAASNLFGGSATIMLAANASMISVNFNQAQLSDPSSATGIKVAPGDSKFLKLIGNSFGCETGGADRADVCVDVSGVQANTHNDIAFNQ